MNQPNETAHVISGDVKKVFEHLLADPYVNSGLEFIQSDNDQTLADQIEITEIPAPPFKEEVRAEYFKKRLEALGLLDARMDREGNVYGIRPGTGEGPKLFISAHLDTVFPEGTDTSVRKEGGRYIGPGITDDGRGLAALLSLVRAFHFANIQTKGDILFGAVVGEEGLGDLRGIKAIFRERHDIDGFISIEPGKPSRTIYLATGSRRYRFTYKGPGGHSYGAFGIPSAIHALGRAIAKISDLCPPEIPKTTFTVGTINGGTSVNTIAAEAIMLIDLRSTSPEELLKIEEQVFAIVKDAAVEENTRWKSDAIQVDIAIVGDRPAGSQPSEAIIVQAALASTEALGFEPLLSQPSSTDANVPISLGIPAVTLGGGGSNGGAHTLDEWFDPTDAHYGVQRIFLTMLGLVGVDNATEPLLQRNGR
ncbi:M20/M25/M40 family metallo-hydrolase [Paenibacillus filicis]|uniref:M20/M25/M40 family metallo-hydrolase n=1 Tax=Paenibacillus gyeongsangnamensis TaxID=3388067 RepID=A0ABT4QEX0_9BACL|nr:M20/M25/M40 family metallo-hydrolase [Paenibacillus filicis]MCZ8515230.1 M20/M25/M40 family metallo-hydrolase [Paenibacillus filicis]